MSVRNIIISVPHDIGSWVCSSLPFARILNVDIGGVARFVVRQGESVRREDKCDEDQGYAQYITSSSARL